MAGTARPFLEVPLINWVSAGRLAEPSRDVGPSDRTVPIADLGAGDYFALEVRGDSMDRQSPEKSIIIVNRRLTALQRRKAYVFQYSGEVTYKLWEPDPMRLEPFSTNIANRPFFITSKAELVVIGRVVRSILDL
jgi:SOS-response transcriptional repressor LexA